MSDDRRWLKECLARLFIETLPRLLADVEMSMAQYLEIDPNAGASFIVARTTITSESEPKIQGALLREPLYNELVTQIITLAELRSAFSVYNRLPEGSNDEEIRSVILSTISLLYRKFAALAATGDSPRLSFDRWWPLVLTQLFDSKSIGIRLLLLSNINVDKPYKLSPSLIIRPERDDDRDRRRQLSQRDHLLTAAKTMLESIVVINDQEFAPSQDEQLLEAALAIFCGIPLPTVFIEQYLTLFRGWGGTTTSAPAHYAWRGSDAIVHITSDKRAAELTDFIEEARKAKSKAVINLATRRYVSGLSRRGLSDRLIDYWIALEALFGEKEGELTFRIALRLAAFLGSDGAERRLIFATAKQSYRLRSQIVHGASGALDPSLIETTESMIRRALYKIVRAPKSYDRALMEAELLSDSALPKSGMLAVPPMPRFD